MINHPSKPDEPADKDELDSPEVISQIVAYEESISSGKPLDPGSTTTLDEFPAGLREELSEVFHCLDLLHDIRRRREQQETLTIGHPANGATTERTETVDVRGQLHVGRFEIREELGQGGHGVVFGAFDPVLKRRVALKVPRPEFLLSIDMGRRFVREAQTVASLDHPHILKVFEAGMDGAVSYIAQELCTGPSLAEWLRQQTGNVDPVLAARIVRDLSRGVQHAHERGILHRDIKPTNVLLQPVTNENVSTAGGGGTNTRHPEEPAAFPFMAKLCDFGIAKVLDDENTASVTQTGAVLGTIAYMSPEQAAGKTSEIGKSTDIYSLGVLLYELLAGRPPFESESRIGLLNKVIDDDPAPLRRRRPDVPSDLEAICFKCLEKLAIARYASAAELADDLDRFLRHDVVRARPRGPVTRLLLQARRRPYSFKFIVGGAILNLIVLTVAGWTEWQRRNEQVETTRRLRQQQSDEQARLEERYPDDVRRAFLLLQGNSAVPNARGDAAEHARQLLKEYVPRPGQPDLRDFAWHYLWKTLHAAEFAPRLVPTREIPAHSGEAYYVTFSPDGQWLATGGSDATARVWNTETGQERWQLVGHERDVNCAEFSPDGKTLATAGDDGTVRLWDAETGHLRQTLWKHTGEVVGVAFHPTNNHLAASTTDGIVRVWEMPAGREIITFQAQEGSRIEAITYSPDGQILATGDHGVGLRLWDATNSYAPHKPIDHLNVRTEAMSFSADGKRIAAADGLSVTIFGIATGDIQSSIRLPEGRIRSLRFQKDGRTLAVVGEQSSTGLLDWTTGEFWNAFDAKTDAWCTACSHDGRWIATTDKDGILRIWDSAARLDFYRTELDIRANSGMICSMSPDGHSLAVAATEGTGAIWNITTSSPIKRLEIPLPGERREIYHVAFAPDGRRVAVGMLVAPFDLSIRFFDVQTGEEQRHTKKQDDTDSPGPAQQVIYTPDGSTVVALHGTGGELGTELRTWDTATGELRKKITRTPTRPFQLPFPIAVSPTGDVLATTVINDTGAIELFSLLDFRQIAEWPALADPIVALAFSPDGQHLIADCGTGHVTIMERLSGKVLRTLNVTGVDAVSGQRGMALSHEGCVLALASSDGIVLADAIKGTGMCTLPFPSPMIRVDDITFGPAGRTVSAVATSTEGKCGVYLWQVDPHDEFAGQ